MRGELLLTNQESLMSEESDENAGAGGKRKQD
jgi:hypothetical protein